MPKRAITHEDLLRFENVADPQINGDGTLILFSKKHTNEKNKNITNLYTVDLDGHVQQWTQGEGGDGHGRWSPDGKTIAFVSGREKPCPQIFLISVSGGEARKLTHLPEGSIGGFRWSPNGKLIAFTFREQHKDWTEKAKKEREEKGLSTPPRELDDIWYRYDGDGYFGPQRFKIYIVDVASGKHREIYHKCPMGMYDFDWSPKSDELAVLHTGNKRPMFEPANDQIYRVKLDGKATQLKGLPKGPKSAIRWSPDGKLLAYLGHPHETDPWGTCNQRLWTVPANGGTPTCMTPDDDYCLAAGTLSDTREAGHSGLLEWSPDSKAIYTQVPWQGESQIGFVELAKPGKAKLLTKGHHVLSMGNISKDGEKIACTYSDSVRLNEVAVYDLSKSKDKPKILTHFNDAFLAEVHVSEPEELWLESPDGNKVHAWVLKPQGFKAPKKYAAVLEIHGGPHGQYGWTFFHEFQLLAAQGYVVVYSNPRGSKGYGEEFTSAIRGDWGNKDWQDIQTVQHWMQHQPFIHAGQIGVMGGSYGGYMTNWAIGHTNDFRAAITDRCVSNLVSMGGSSDFVQTEDVYWKGVFFGDIEALWKNSPLAYFKNVKTPTLIIHSEGDLRCNIEQSEQVFSALHHLGVETRFVRYPQSTSHGMSRSGPSDLRIHRLKEITNWWKEHLNS